MKKVVFLIMILIIISASTVFAEHTYEDGTVLSDKEELVYNAMTSLASDYYDPASMRVHGVNKIYAKDMDKYKEGKIGITLCISAKNRMGGRREATFQYVFPDGHYINDYDWNRIDDPDPDVNLKKINHVWKYYHDDDDD